MRVYLAYSRDLQAQANIAREVIEELGLHTPEWERSMIGVSKGALYEGARRSLEQADIFVGLIGNNYGWVPEQDFYGEGTFDGETSFFHSEFLWAEQRGMPMLVFFAPSLYYEEYAEAAKLISGDQVETEQDRIERLLELRNYLLARYHCPIFERSAQLREQVGMSLMRLIHMQRYGDGANRDVVFISHATIDDAFVDTLADSLERAGLYPWVDHRHIPSGARWDAVLEHALSAADALVLVVSPESRRSTVVESEWTYMGELGRKIYPVLLRGDKIPFRLRVLQITDFRDDYEAGTAQLLTALSVQEELQESTTTLEPQSADEEDAPAEERT